ncbi:MAG: bifunctional folylpolyglutamate synthase/dihydrofolate synthase [Candidatus Omnitrophica bacterium]|nr:bifunctional folylpolyglutamate synthase/dihydrofolate synthase [Candidatus Omnitrophota bacterium]MDD5436922.1 bifunctional folylpolyglutamate synthase/dihydrofolate synthase [Candidatus Omnitrophota bacterium]
MTYKEALQYLDSFVNYERRDDYDYKRSFRLDRMERLAAGLGDPQKYFRSIHIAGTKGKGSTSAIAYSILKEAGYRTGLYTSPHLISFRERIRIDDKFISEEDVSRLLSKIKDVIDDMPEAGRPTFFEVYTALSYLYFKEAKVDFAVFEVGLGGRLDATNILEPLVSVITPISYEHTDKLGHTLAEIAGEKAGIIKEDATCIIAPQEEEALKTILRVCEDKRARPVLVGKDIRFEGFEFNDSKEIFGVAGLSSRYPRLEMALLGSHQIVNAATAIGIIESLRLKGIDITDDAVRRGVRNARWPGRLEIVSKRPYLLIDGAQNRASANALVKAVKRIFRYNKLVLVLGVSKDKDIKGMLEELLPVSDRIILTKAKVIERAAEPQRIKEFITRTDKDIYLTSSVKEAVSMARSLAAPDDLILITGSLFVVGEAIDE